MIGIVPRAESARTPVLDAADYDAILDLVHAVADIDHPDQFAEIAVDQIGSVVASDFTSLNDVDPIAATFRSVFSPRTFPIDDFEAVTTALRDLSSQHPLIAHMSATGDGSAIKISDFWSRAQWRASELYRRVYARMGVEHQMAIALPTPQPAVVGLALNRCGTEPGDDFSERDRAVLNRIRPHLAQSWRNATERARLRSLLAATNVALEAADTAVLLLTNPIQELNPGTLTDLYRFYGRPSDHTALPTRVQRWLEQQRASHNRAGLDDLTRPLNAIRGRRRMIIRYLPGAGHDDALLLRITPATHLPHELATLGLSPREAEVLTALTTGATNADIAARLHLAPATVKNHLEHIYRKLGAHGRVQATTIALTMLNPGRV
jgi:DNA-binding CsgD family transcriptional regulator